MEKKSDNKSSIYSELSKKHLTLIGKRFLDIRQDLNLSSLEIEDKLNLPGAVITRFENGKGIQIFNLLKIINWLHSMDYNMNWLFLYDNTDTFIKNQDALSLYTDALPSMSFKKKEIINESEKILERINNLKDLISKY